MCAYKSTSTLLSDSKTYDDSGSTIYSIKEMNCEADSGNVGNVRFASEGQINILHDYPGHFY